MISRPLLPEDVVRAGGVAAAAFIDDPAWTWVFPDRDDRLKLGRLLFESLFALDLAHGARVTAAGEDHLLGVRTTYHSGLKPPSLLAWLPRFRKLAPILARPASVLRAHRIENAIELARGEAGDRPYLRILAVAPEYQKQGVGSALMEGLISDDSPWYLETFQKANLPFYERYGFKVLGESRPIGGPPFWRMAR
jgi:GNAT superfamily N-acetyltransferase